jgi:RNA ligase
MATFQHIENVHQLRQHVAHHPEIQLQQRDSFKVASAMIGNPELYDNPWARECRGNVFGPDGLIAARTLHKFFNVNEREDTQAHRIDWRSAERVMQKRDGSMIHTVAMPSSSSRLIGYHDFDIKSKKSFTSDVANVARAFLQRKANIIQLCEHVVACNSTAIFEYTAPEARIVIAYPTEKLVLLHVRHNITGKYWSEAELLALGQVFSVEVVTSYHELVEQLKTVPKPFDVLCKLSTEITDTEGWVIQLKNGEMYKVKTDWYMDRHHKVTFLRERMVAEMVLNESIDDLKAVLISSGLKVARVLELEAEVMKQLFELQASIAEVAAAIKGLNQREAFAQHGTFKYFKFAKLVNMGKEIDYKAILLRELKDRFGHEYVQTGAVAPDQVEE